MSNSDEERIQHAGEAITAERLLEHIRVLSSDEFGGRLPGSAGETLTVDYVTEQFRELGLEPGNPDGTYVQDVPLVGHVSTTSMKLTAGSTELGAEYATDYVAGSRRISSEVDVSDSEMVFVGYGVVAPEFDWDDYKAVDLTGKTLVVLVSDPPIPDPNDPTQLDATMFNGKAMTYYGRWTYKYEMATELGAAAVLIVHETEPAGYPWEVVDNSWSGETFDLESPDQNMGRVAVEGWITRGKAEQLFSAAGKDFDALKEAALNKDFVPVPLGARASFRVTNDIRRVQSQNVVALIPGSDLAHRDEYVIYSAHWDHLGTTDAADGPQIFSGAVDNASGTGGIIEIARAFQTLEPTPKRSILFIAVTAEEQGLLGARFYGENPLYPLAKTVADINIDGLNAWGETKDLEVIGYGNSTLDDLIEGIAQAHGRVIVPDTEPENGYFYRADHFEFAKQGVPAFFSASGIQYIGQPAEWGIERRDRYTAEDYHKPSDVVKDGWDLSGAAADARLMFELGVELGSGGAWPTWKDGTEFKAKRQAMLG